MTLQGQQNALQKSKAVHMTLVLECSYDHSYVSCDHNVYHVITVTQLSCDHSYVCTWVDNYDHMMHT